MPEPYGSGPLAGAGQERCGSATRAVKLREPRRRHEEGKLAVVGRPPIGPSTTDYEWEAAGAPPPSPQASPGNGRARALAQPCQRFMPEPPHPPTFSTSSHRMVARCV